MKKIAGNCLLIGMKYISLHWTLALKFSIGKKRECATAKYLWRTTVLCFSVTNT